MEVTARVVLRILLYFLLYFHNLKWTVLGSDRQSDRKSAWKLIGSDQQPDAVIIHSETTQLVTIL